jgi:hypothetical protein
MEGTGVFGAWRGGFAADPVLQERVNSLAGQLSPGPERQPDWRNITRNDVFGASTAAHTVLATLAWGYGTVGYGWRRSLNILSEFRDDALTAALEVLRQSFAEDGSAGMDVFLCWRSGEDARPRHRFASKVAYFACYSRPRGTGPLIADRNSAWAFWAAEGTWDIRVSGERYDLYVTTAERWAAE